jgi:hypothetical protein
LGGLETCTDEISSSEYLAASPSRAWACRKTIAVPSDLCEWSHLQE